MEYDALSELRRYSEVYAGVSDDKYFSGKMPGNAWFIENEEVMALPRTDGDCRYPYGSDGFNFWAYSSGYMHCNDGLFSVFLRSSEGADPNIAWFAGISHIDKTKTISLLNVPNMDDGAVRYTVFNKSYITYVTEYDGLCFGVRVFVDVKRNMFFTVSVINNNEDSKEVFLSSYINSFLQHGIYPCGEDRWFREASLISGNDALPTFTLKCNINVSRTRQVTNLAALVRSVKTFGDSKIVSHQETTSRQQYIGSAIGNLNNPKAVKEGCFARKVHTSAFTETGIFGDIISFEISPRSAIRTDSVMRYEVYSEKPEFSQKLLEAIPENLDEIISRAVVQQAEKDNALKFEPAGGCLDKLTAYSFGEFLAQNKKQVEFCALLKGFAQPGAGSLIGIRDIMQALEAFLIWQPKLARTKILEAMGFIAPDGRCPRQYSLPESEDAPPRMDLREFIDQGVWVVSTLSNYLKFTGDFSILEETCGYYEIIDEESNLVRKSEIRDTVLEHLIKIVNWLVSKEDKKTGCTRVLFGDWNDALDGLGVDISRKNKFGSGVSVMAASQVWQSLNEMIEMLEIACPGKYCEIKMNWKQSAERLVKGLQKYGVVENSSGVKRIVHGWGDQMSYYVGGWDDPDGKPRRSLTSNAFWSLSGLLDLDTSLEETIYRDILATDSKYGLKTFDEGFESNTKGVGRIPKLPMGTAENGAAYVHASMFGTMALFKMGYSIDGWKTLAKSLPITHESVSASPFVIPNSYGYNVQKNIDGESMMDWQTGASNVFLKTVVYYIIGIRPQYEGIWIQPAANLPFKKFTAEINIRGALFKIEINTAADKRKFLVNQKEAESIWDEKMKINKLWIPYNSMQNEMIIEITDITEGN